MFRSPCAPNGFVHLVAVVAILTTGGYAAAEFDHQDAVAVQVIENTSEAVTLHYEFPALVQKSVEIDGVEYARILLPDEPVLQQKGAPALPHVARSIIIPDDAAMEAHVVAAEFVEVTDIDVMPSKGVIPRSINPADVPFSFDDRVYGVDADFPGALVELSEPYILRDHRGTVVDVFPFQYNPVTRTLRIYSTLTIAVETAGDSNINVLRRARTEEDLSLSFHQLYDHHFVNYAPTLRYPVLDETGDMLIICHDAWLPNIQPLVDHKNSIGINTTAVGVSTIGNNSTSIKNYIQSVYDNGDLAFVLLVGDHTQVDTPIITAGYYTGASDPSYSKLAGSDNWPDIFVGRFSAESAAHVDTQVERTIAYETELTTQQPWFWRAVGIASDEGGGSQGDDGESDIQHMNNIRTDLQAHGYTTVNQIYDPGASSSSVTNALHDGRGLINYVGHGSSTSWSTTGFSTYNVDALQNNGMLPVIVSVACVNGEFDAGYTCFAEAWLRATNNGEPAGAAAVYMSSINQSWDSPMCGQDEVVDRYCAQDYVTYGALCFAGSCQMMEEYGSDGINMFNTWHIFGDPSLRIVGVPLPPSGLWVTPSDTLFAEGPSGGPFPPTELTYTLENRGDEAFDYFVDVDANWLNVSDAYGTLGGRESNVVTITLDTAAAENLGNGLYTGTLTFTNLTTGEGNAVREAHLKVGVPTPQFVWNLDDDPAWTCEGDWEWGVPQGLGGDHGGDDPTSGYTGDNVYGYNLAGGYNNNMAEQHLTAGPVDLTDMHEVSVRYYRWINVEQPSYDKASFRVSNDGVNWTDIWQHNATILDNSWVYQEFDISEHVADQPTVYLRWTMGETDISWTYGGWNIDDVEIWALAPDTPQGPSGDMNCDGTTDYFDINPFLVALQGEAAYDAEYPECDWLNGDFDEDGAVSYFDIDPFVNSLD